MDCVSEISYTKQFDRNLFRIKLEAASLLKVEFTYYSLRNLEDPHIVEGMRVDSFLDIVVNKLWAIADRTEAKDFVDVYSSLRSGSCRKKCAISGIRHILKRRLLQIPGGINRLPLKAEIKAQEIEALFEKLIRKMVGKEVGERK